MTYDWSDAIRAEFDLAAEAEQMLQAAEQAYARWKQIEEVLDAEPLTVTGRYEGMSKTNPLVLAEQRARESFVRALKALKIPEK